MDAFAQRCFVQVLDANGNTLDDFSLVKQMSGDATEDFTTTVYLNKGVTYNFLFWADNSSSSAPTDLKNVSYTNGETIAWVGKMEAAWSENGASCDLLHIVARITVHSTTAVQ